MNFIENINKSQFDFRDSFKYFCLKNCVCQLLSACVHNPFAYINAVPCVYVYFSNQLPEGYAIRYNKNPLQDIYKSYFITIEPKQKCAKQNFHEITKTIDRQIPVIASTDGFYLPYKQHYNKYHASHAIIIYGYDDICKNTYIIDCYDKDNFNGLLSYDAFFVSWSSSNPSEANPFSGSPINNVWSYLQPFNKERTSIELVRDTLKKTEETFHSRVGHYCFLGIDGLLKLKSLLEYRIKAGYRINFERLHRSLYMYLREKVLFKDYLNFHADCLDSMDAISVFLEKNTFCWNVFLTYILKLNTLNKKISLDKFNTLFKDLIDSEEQLYQAICNTKI